MEDSTQIANQILPAPQHGFRRYARSPKWKLFPRPAFTLIFKPGLFLFVFYLVLASPGTWATGNILPIPKRIVSLSPGITEILFALGVGDRVVGVTDFCNYPEAATRLPKIGGILNPSYEKLISLRPDLIIHQPDSRKIETFIRQLNVSGLAVPMLTLDQIFAAIRKIGQATQSTGAADNLIRKMNRKLEDYRKRLAAVNKKSVLLLLGVSAGPSRDLYGVGGKTFLGELLALAGGENILTDSMALYPKLSREFIIRRSPEVIIEVGPKAILSSMEMEKRKREWRRFPTIRAVKNHNIHFIGSDYVLIPGPRLIRIIDRFVRAIHPELATSPIRLGQAGIPGQEIP